MTESDYDALCRACDRLLRHADADLTWLATPALHVLSEHPVHLAQYADLCRETGSTAPPVRRFGQERSGAYRMASLVRRCAGASTTGSLPALAAPDLRPGRPAALLVSWLVNAAHLEGEDDFYFGALQQALAARGVESLLVLRNQSGIAGSTLEAAARRSYPCARLLLPDRGSVADERQMVGAQLTARRRMAAAAGGQAEVDAKVARFIRRRLPSSLVSENLLLHAQLRALCRALRPGLVVTLYEGHAWERCVWDAARREVPEVVCAGYQHTILRRRAHAAARAIGAGKGWDADVLLALGTTTARRLRASAELARTPVLVLGTHRGGGPPAAARPVTGRRSILVTPEGLEDECLHLFGVALRAAALAPDLRFVLRTHPVLPFARIARRLPGGGALPPNVEVSGAGDMHEEFARNDLCLYRGSSVALYAVLAGLQPVYAARAGEMTIDPLHDLADWRLAVHSPEDLVHAAAAAAAADPGARLQAWTRAAARCAEYVRPFTASAVDDLLGLLHARAAAGAPRVAAGHQ